MMWRLESLSALKMTHLGICLTHLGIKLPPSHGDIERPKLGSKCERPPKTNYQANRGGYQETHFITDQSPNLRIDLGNNPR